MHVLLTMTTGDGRKRSFRMRRACNVIGRSHRCDLRLPLPSVALQHCKITIEADRAAIKSLAPDAQVLLNGSPLRDGGIQTGDMLQIGPVAFRVAVVAADVQAGEDDVVEMKPQADLVDPDDIAAGGFGTETRSGKDAH